MPGILIVDPSPLCSELLAPLLESYGFSVACCASAVQAAALLPRLEPDLLILETADPGAFSLLQSLRANADLAHVAVVVLTDEASRESICRAGGLGVRDYMLKSRFTRSELLTRVRKHIAPGTALPKRAATAAAAVAAAAPAASPGSRRNSHSARSAPPAPPSARDEGSTAATAAAAVRDAARLAGIGLHTRDDMLQRIEQAQVKTLPGAVSELMALVTSPRGSIADVAQVLRHDPVLSSRVLRVANSAAFASQRARIANVEDAVKHIGMGGVRNLVSTVGIFETFGPAGAAGDDLTLLRCWQHSLAVASLMEKLLPRDDDSAPAGIGYVVGLCHDLPDIVLRQDFPDDYAHVLDLVGKTGCAPRLVQSVVFGLPGEQLAMCLLTRLGLPPAITAPIQELFERAAHKQAPRSGSLLARVLRIANVYAHGLMLAATASDPVVPLTRSECSTTLGEDRWPIVDDLALRGEVLATAGAMANLSSADMARACEPLVRRRPLRLCYVRHRDYAEALDPLHSLLRLAAESVEVASALPSDALDGVDALIVAAPRSGAGAAHDADLARLANLLEARPMPALYLGGAGVERANLPDSITACPLPVTIAALGDFLAHGDSQRGASAPAATAKVAA